MKACEKQPEKECLRVAAIVSTLRSYYWASVAVEGGALSNRSPYWSKASVSESVTWGDEQHCWVCGTHRTRHGYSLINWSHTALLTGVIWIKKTNKNCKWLAHTSDGFERARQQNFRVGGMWQTSDSGLEKERVSSKVGIYPSSKT